MKRVQHIAVVGLASAIAVLIISARPIVSGQSKTATGFFPQRVARVEQLIQRHVDERKLPCPRIDAGPDGSLDRPEH